MLKIRFYNVGDGDCILVEETYGKEVFRMLVDAGREHVPEAPPADVCAEHLAREQISHLDKVIITHLHADHIGGLGALINGCAIDEIMSGYFPLCPGERIPWDNRADRSVKGLVACLNQWSRDVERLKNAGCRTTELFATWRNVQLTPRLSADLIVPDVRDLRLQRDVYNRMLAGEHVPMHLRLRASKLRNPNSLRLRLRYAGRQIELAGDCYGSVWEKQEIAPCDIFKTPHHGDPKAVTDMLLAKLRPAHTIISCSRFYQSAKDRPSADVISRLRRIGSRIYYTDAFSDDFQSPRLWPAVEFIIDSDGRISAPD